MKNVGKVRMVMCTLSNLGPNGCEHNRGVLYPVIEELEKYFEDGVKAKKYRYVTCSFWGVAGTNQVVGELIEDDETGVGGFVHRGMMFGIATPMTQRDLVNQGMARLG